MAFSVTTKAGRYVAGTSGGRVPGSSVANRARRSASTSSEKLPVSATTVLSAR